jgi:hypothetical protein
MRIFAAIALFIVVSASLLPAQAACKGCGRAYKCSISVRTKESESYVGLMGFGPKCVMVEQILPTYNYVNHFCECKESEEEGIWLCTFRKEELQGAGPGWNAPAEAGCTWNGGYESDNCQNIHLSCR